jgi:hypothetical protein
VNHRTRFFQTKLHGDTKFSLDQQYYPEPNKANASDDADAYSRLRHVAKSNERPEAEHFFFRQEMRCKAVTEGFPDGWFIRAYEAVSDFGFSVWRPLAWLVCFVVVGWAITGLWLKHGTPPEGQAVLSNSPIAEGLGISIGNTLPFLGLVRKMHPTFYQEAPAWLDAVSGFQSVAGIVLLFFLGLGLRNRFRLK